MNYKSLYQITQYLLFEVNFFFLISIGFFFDKYNGKSKINKNILNNLAALSQIFNLDIGEYFLKYLLFLNSE